MIFGTDPWSDGSICLLRNIPSLIGWPRVINVVGYVASIQWFITWNEVSLRLLCRSLYINLPLHPSFSTFHRNLTIRVLSSPLLDKHIVQLMHPSSTPFCCSSSVGKWYSSPFIKELFVIFLYFVLSSPILDLSVF